MPRISRRNCYRPRVAALFVILFVSGLHPLGAQVQTAQPHARIQSLLEASDFAALAQMEPSGSRLEQEDVRAMRSFASWVITGDRGEVEAALFRLASANGLSPRDPWPSYLAARVHLDMNARGAPVLASAGQYLGESHLDAAIRHLAAALAVDSVMPEATRLLTRIAYASGEREPRGWLRNSVERALRQTLTPAKLHIVAARWHRMQNELSEAEERLTRAEALEADPGVIALERARTFIAAGDSASAVDQYLQGIVGLSAEGRDLYRQDIAALISPDSLAVFDQLSPPELESWLRLFWAERDAAAANQPGQRLLEHLRRWTVVHQRFRVSAPWSRTGFSRVDVGIEGFPPCLGNATAFYEQLPIRPPTLNGDPRFREPLLDHRGLVYLRHGEPYARTQVGGATDTLIADLGGMTRPALVREDEDEVTFVTQPGTRQVSSWVYWIDEGWRTFNFTGSRALGDQAPTTLVSFLPLSVAAWDALGLILPQYAGTRGPCSREGAAAVRRQRADAYLATTTDTDVPQVNRPWNAPIRMYGVPDRESAGKALISFAIPAIDLQVDTVSAIPVWDLGFRAVAFRPSDGETVVLDTLRRYVARDVGEDDHVTGYLELPVPAGEWNIALRGWQGSGDSVSIYAVRRSVRVEPLSNLGSSDLIVGSANGVTWHGAEDFALNPLGVWSRRTPLELWYRLVGLRPGETFQLRIEVEPTATNRRAARPISLESEETAADSTVVVRRRLGVEQLPAGSYLITVTVTTDSGVITKSAAVVIDD